jgi:enamine deaminase RidA (YjgF/YER057c/UK114 family)
MSIKRIEAGSRMSQAVIHGDTVYLAGQVAQKSPGKPVGDQTQEILGSIDRLLAEAGTDKSKILSAQIWLADIATFNEMNEVWDAWLSPGNAPARATVEAKLAAPDYTVEIMVVAAR